uniref:PIF-1 n=1 Tax=Nilaparvata lugens endogenous nudivirus TaxID=1487700 RepID=X5GYB7_9VIRU|nr:PIF-1 [Nilaparvata lugens endogenous nudivirus]
METYNSWSGVLIILLIIIVLVLSLVLANDRVQPIVGADFEIPEFSVPVHWDPYPDVVEIENKIDCNLQSLHVCKLDDPTTLFGCRELAVRCHHFSEDVNYYENGNSTIIPKNKVENEGYALAITSLADSCNLYHGDLVLVDKNPNTNEYMLICNCKNPGYIGNEDILGPCTSVFICNGKIDGIDKPLESINCICKDDEVTTRYDDGLPVCKTMLVYEANAKYSNWTHLVPWSSDRLLRKSQFNPTVRDNVKTDFLLDPCRNSIQDPTVEILNGSYSPALKSCTFKDYGIPVRTGILDQHQQKPGDIVEYNTVDSALLSDKHTSLRIADNVAGKRMLINVCTRLNSYKFAVPKVYVNLPQNIGYSDGGQFHITPRQNQLVAGKCTSDWPHYSCELDENSAGTVFGVPYAGYNTPPFSLLWGTQDWTATELAVNSGVHIHKIGTTIDNSIFMVKDNWLGYGMQYCSDSSDPKECTSGMLSFNDRLDYNRHKSVLT